MLRQEPEGTRKARKAEVDIDNGVYTAWLGSAVVASRFAWTLVAVIVVS